MTSISSQADLLTWAATGAAGTITSDFTMTSDTGFPVNLTDGCTLDGGGYTITLHVDNKGGLFKQVTGGNSTVSFQDFILDVTAVGTLELERGALIYDCWRTGNVTTITDVGVIDTAGTKTFKPYDGGGGLVGASENSAGAHTLTLSGCWAVGKEIGSNSGGLAGRNTGYAGTCTISDCWTNFDQPESGTGGICAGNFGGGAGTHVIKNCYALGNITGGGSGGIVGSSAGNSNTTGTVTIANCYHSGTFSGGGTNSIAGIGTSATTTVVNCYSVHAEDNTTGLMSGNGTLTNCEGTNGTWSQDLTSPGLIDSYGGNSNVWISTSGFSGGFGLTKFNESPWDVDTSYTTASSIPVFGAAGGEGDPHIRTLNGKIYDAITDKFFRLFDNNNPDSRLVINAQVDRSKHPIWYYKEYMTKIFISHKNNICVIDPGFRGAKSTVIYNDGFAIDEEQLDLRTDHKQFCSECTYRNRTEKLMYRHKRNENHKILQNVRNKLTLKIDTGNNIYTLEITNVNADNFMPAQVRVKLQHKKNIKDYLGALTKVSAPHTHDVKSLFDTDPCMGATVHMLEKILDNVPTNVPKSCSHNEDAIDDTLEHGEEIRVV
jgi:hypothetical protein